MRILVVEDEKRIADFLARGLESGGYAVDAANNGSTALDLVHGTEYDLIILDLGLPDIDGLQVLQKVRNRKTSPPVLILSARDAIEDRVKGLEVGADDYLREAVRLRRTAGSSTCTSPTRPADPGASASRRARTRLHPPQSDSRRREHRTRSQRVQHSRVHDAQPRPPAQPHHDRRACLGYGL